MRAFISALVAATAICGPVQAQSTSWLSLDQDGFVTASSGVQEGISISCGGGALTVGYSIQKSALPAGLADVKNPELTILTDSGTTLGSTSDRRDGVVWWRFNVTGAAAVGIATTIYASDTITVSLGADKVEDIDIKSGRTSIFAALDACRINVAQPSQEDESIEIPSDRWIFAEHPDEGPFAATRAGEALVMVTCSYGRYQLDYSFPEADIDQDVTKNDRAVLVLGVDGTPVSFFEDIQGIRGTDRIMFSVPAEQWLDPISGAGEAIYLGLGENGTGRLGKNVADFTARGSTAAIASLRRACQPT